ncbi:MAG: signal recognition particle receptor subunit alpha, partial [Lachnospiraceae bacterium]|nr:signal recognition particle receptor subunit alpha [Lachnospiraceae bacterium]
MAEKSSFFKKLIGGLSKTRRSIVNNLESLFMGVSSIDEDFYEELEEILISGDLGVYTTEKII